jgi:DNA (cytosine-5)-methyltransferase 1
MLRYASVCDGIGAVHVAARGLGWECAWTSEIEPFPIAVVDHHYGYPNLGDMLAVTEADLERHGRIDLLVGGTPCQSFSVAGLRGGLADPRGNLALRFLQLAGAARPRWVVWENVPGVLSSTSYNAPDPVPPPPPVDVGQHGITMETDDEFDTEESNDFGCVLAGLAELGYGFAYRVLDAQFVRVDGHERAVPQRRRRVFVVGHLGDWRGAAAVLLERASLCGHPAPSREAGAGVAASLTRGADSGGKGGYAGRRLEDAYNVVVPAAANPLTARMHKGVAHALRAEGFDASEDGTGRGTPLVFDAAQVTSAGNYSSPSPGDPCHPLAAGSAHAAAVAFQTRIARNGRGQPKDVTDALTSCEGGTHADSKPHVAYHGGVRRLTARECERLQGFPDDYTRVTFKGKPAADGPRYRALGNSMATNVIRWLWRRIEMVEQHRATA